MELVHDYNSQIKHLENAIKHINCILKYELADLRSKTDNLHESHEAQISEQIK